MSSLPSTNGIGTLVYQTLGHYLRKDPSSLRAEDSLRDDLALDSLQTIELIYEVESAFDLEIPDDDFGRLTTIGDVVDYLIERTKGTPHALHPPTNNNNSSPKVDSKSHPQSIPKSHSPHS